MTEESIQERLARARLARAPAKHPVPVANPSDHGVGWFISEIARLQAERDIAHREIEEVERVLCAEPIDGGDDLATCARQVVANMDALRSAFDALARAVDIAVEGTGGEATVAFWSLAAAARTAVKAREHLRAAPRDMAPP